MANRRVPAIRTREPDMKLFRRFADSAGESTAIEYVLVAGLIAITIATLVQLVGASPVPGKVGAALH